MSVPSICAAAPGKSILLAAGWQTSFHIFPAPVPPGPGETYLLYQAWHLHRASFAFYIPVGSGFPGWSCHGFAFLSAEAPHTNQSFLSRMWLHRFASGSGPRRSFRLCFLVAAMSQFSPFDIGQIKAHMYHGLCGAEIARICRHIPWGWKFRSLPPGVTLGLCQHSR